MNKRNATLSFFFELNWFQFLFQLIKTLLILSTQVVTMAQMVTNWKYNNFVSAAAILQPECDSCKLPIKLMDLGDFTKKRNIYNMAEPNHNVLKKLKCCGAIGHLQCFERIEVGRYSRERKVCPKCLTPFDSDTSQGILEDWKNIKKIQSNNAIKLITYHGTDIVQFRTGINIKCIKYKKDYQCEVLDSKFEFTLVKFNEKDICWEENRHLKLA